MKRLNRKWRVVIYFFLTLIALINVIAFSHAYKFTHFSSEEGIKTTSSDELSSLNKLKILFLGINNPRPRNKTLPHKPFKTIMLEGEKRLECWYITSEAKKGTVLLFHGYSGEKSSLLDKAEVFIGLGYHVLLVDFAGSGGSEGNVTTIGYKESNQVKQCFDHIAQTRPGEVILYGTSMGAVAIMKALYDSNLPVSKVILECPFATMQETVDARFKMMNVPSFPMSHLLMFWGGVQNGFWAYDHNPEVYASRITCPVLLMHGSKDPKVSEGEIVRIFNAVKSSKSLVKFEEAGHEDYLKFGTKWQDAIADFLAS